MRLEQESAESAANGSAAPPAKASGEADAPSLRSPACGQGTQIPRIPSSADRKAVAGKGYALLSERASGEYENSKDWQQHF